MKPKEFQFWNAYLLDSHNQKSLANASVYASMPGNEQIADYLLGLYLSGKKTAGSGLVKDYENSGDPLPSVGNYWIVLDSRGDPKCIVKTVRVEFFQFAQVPEEVAIAEGEGDLSIEYWQREHARFFLPSLKELEILDLSKAEVVTEFFQLVFKS